MDTNPNNMADNHLDGNLPTPQSPAGETSRQLCPNCGAEISPDAKFCGHCGADTGLFCPNCGDKLEPGVKFCGGCGAALSAEASAGRITDRIEQFIRESEVDSPVVLTGANLTPDIIKIAGIPLQEGEKPLLMLKNWLDFVGKTPVLTKLKAGTILLTDRRLIWWRLGPIGIFAPITGLWKRLSGEIGLEDVEEIGIGDAAWSGGGSYLGHPLCLSGEIAGLLWMGNGTVDHDAVAKYLNLVFGACFGA